MPFSSTQSCVSLLRPFVALRCRCPIWAGLPDLIGFPVEIHISLPTIRPARTPVGRGLFHFHLHSLVWPSLFPLCWTPPHPRQALSSFASLSKYQSAEKARRKARTCRIWVSQPLPVSLTCRARLQRHWPASSWAPPVSLIPRYKVARVSPRIASFSYETASQDSTLDSLSL
jgi:hypothetical protein